MNLGILKFIGLGVIGIGGAGAAIIFGSKQAREFLGLSSHKDSLSEEDKQYQFLYELSKKLFEALSNISGVSAHGKENVIKWLKDQFSVSLENEEDKWENFKSLCEAQKTKETQEGNNVNNEHARLCFVDEGENPKGYLWHWYNKDDPKISPNNQIAFLDMDRKNIDLWNEFKSQYPSSNPIDKFDEWYNSLSLRTSLTDTTIRGLKGVMDKLLVKTS